VALALWYLGYPDQALDRIYQTLHRAQEVAHPLGVVFTQFWTAFLHHRRGEVQKAQEQTATLLAQAQELESPQHVALGLGLRGYTLSEQGQREEGIAQIHQGIAAYCVTGAELARPYFLALLAEVYGKGGQVKEGMQALTEALDITHRGGKCMHQAELYRLRGELTLAQSRTSLEQVKTSQDKSEDTDPRPPTLDPQGEAQACFLKAVDVARQQQAKSLELRAVMSLARLWQSQGKQHAARTTLSEIYGWFTEGFDTKDLQEAKMLLEELSH
jgi:predicted ATPase